MNAIPLILAATFAAPAPPLPVLMWKFNEGDVFFLETKTTTKQKMVVMNMTVEQTQEQTFLHRYTVKRIDRQGRVVLEQKIEDVKLQINIGGAPTDLDDFARKLRGASLEITLDPTGKVFQVDGLPNLINKFGPGQSPLVGQILTEESVKQMVEQQFAILPRKRVELDERWERKTSLHMGPIGTYETTLRYRYEGKVKPENKLDRVTFTSSLKYVPPAPAAQGQGGALPFQIKRGDLKSDDGKGQLIFDSSKGRLKEVQDAQTVRGKLVIEIGGQETEIELNQEQATKISLVEKGR